MSASDPLQFEATSDWQVIQGHAQSLTLSGVHTQGTSALAVTAPQGYTRLESVRIDSSNSNAAKIDSGASLDLDLQLPVQQANPFWFGAVQAYLSAPSRNVHNAYLGQVELTGMRTGTFTTLHFKVPDYATSALKNATYTDLTVGIVLNVPSNSVGVYRLDNLRIKGPLPPPPTDASQIVEGQSIQLQPSRSYAPPTSQPDSRSFAQHVVQIPQRFHVIHGKTGNGSATFEYRLGSGAIEVCTYVAADSRTDYVYGSCTSGALAGDLVPADFVRLTVVDGDSTAGPTAIAAQIALDPCGDELVTGLPPIPTFFGSTGAEVSAALDEFLQQQRNWQISDSELVRLPTPALPLDALVTQNASIHRAAASSNGAPFSQSDRLTHSDLADAGWHVNGNIGATSDATGARSTHFDVDMGVDLWVLTAKITDFLGFSGSVDTHTAAFNGTDVPPTSNSGQVCFRFLGFGKSCESELNKNLADVDQSVSVIDITYWVFHVAASGHLVFTLDTTGEFVANGVTLTLQPHASFGLHLEGGLAVATFAGGGLFADLDLIAIDTPITGSVSASLHASPQACNVHISENLQASATVSTGGGKIGYYIEGGLTCGISSIGCWRDNGSLLSWKGFSETVGIIPDGDLADQDIPLDPALCVPGGLADGGITYPVIGESFHPGDLSFLQGSFSRTFVNTDGVLSPPVHFGCNTLTWSSSNPSDVITPVNGASADGCVATIQYGGSGTRTITLTASDPTLGQGLDTRATFIVTGDPSAAPVVTMTQPRILESTDECGGFTGSGSASDPGGASVVLEWFEVSPGDVAATSLGTEATLPLHLKGKGEVIVRLVATTANGKQAFVERPVSRACVK